MNDLDNSLGEAEDTQPQVLPWPAIGLGAYVGLFLLYVLGMGLVT